MGLTSSVGTALMFAASALTLSSAHLLQYTIRVRNLTYQQPFSPIILAAHTKEVTPFEEGLPATDRLKQLVENGDRPDIAALAEAAGVTEHLCGYVVGDDPLMPGATERLTLTVDEDVCVGGGVISMISMLVNTNDAFVGFASTNLKTRGSSKIYPSAWDAGTEENNELCTHIPGPACDATSGNLEAGPGEGYVHIHRGVHGVSGELPAADYTWLNPVAEVYIAKPVDV